MRPAPPSTETASRRRFRFRIAWTSRFRSTRQPRRATNCLPIPTRIFMTSPRRDCAFFTVYGPFGRPDMAYFKFTKAIYEGKPIDVYNDGNMLRDFTFVDDVTACVERMLFSPPKPDETGARNAVYNIGNNRPVRLLDFIHSLERARRKNRRTAVSADAGGGCGEDLMRIFTKPSATLTLRQRPALTKACRRLPTGIADIIPKRRRNSNSTNHVWH